MTATVEAPAPSAQLIAVADIINHPHNPRFSLEDLNSDGLLDSVKRFGILVPLLVSAVKTNEGQRYELLDGHRRVQAAREAGVTQVVAVIGEQGSRPDDIAKMLQIGTARTGLNGHEIVKAMQTQIDLGASLKQVSEQTGLPQTVIKGSIAAVQMEPVAKGLADGQLSFANAAALNEFHDHPELIEDLSRFEGRDFDWRVKQVRQELKRAKSKAALTAQLEKDGVKVVDVQEYRYGGNDNGARRVVELKGEDGNPMTEEQHKDCPHRGVSLRLSRDDDSWDVLPACADYKAAGHKQLPNSSGSAARPRDFEAEKKEAARKDQERIARELRREFLIGRKIDASLELEILRLTVLRRLPSYLKGGAAGAGASDLGYTPTTLDDILGLAQVFRVKVEQPEQPKRDSQAHRDRRLQAARDAAPHFLVAAAQANKATLLKAMLLMWVRDAEYGLERDSYSETGKSLVPAYRRLLKEAGYQPSDQERALEAAEAAEREEREARAAVDKAQRDQERQADYERQEPLRVKLAEFEVLRLEKGLGDEDGKCRWCGEEEGVKVVRYSVCTAPGQYEGSNNVPMCPAHLTELNAVSAEVNAATNAAKLAAAVAARKSEPDPEASDGPDPEDGESDAEDLAGEEDEEGGDDEDAGDEEAPF